MGTVLIFAGGETPPPGIVDDLPSEGTVVAADSGYDSAVELGYRVDVVVGDLDSLRAVELPSHVIVERHPVSKDATDLELAMELATRDSPDRLVVVGGSGGRIDHELAIAALLCSDRWEEIDEIDWVSGRGRGHVVRRRRTVHGDVGATLTLMAVGGPAAGIHTTGLQWNFKDGALEPGSTRGVSNVMTSPVADIRVGSGCLLALLPAG